MEDTRSPDPLTLDQLRAVKEAASRLSNRHRLLAHVIPHSGLSRGEFVHLTREWLIYRYDDGSDDFSTETGSPDRIVITIPESSPCVGTLKFDFRGMALKEREKPCEFCSPDDVWTPSYTGRVGRRVLVDNADAVDALYWWFSRYDSMPFSPKGSVYDWFDEIAAEAGLSRSFGFTALRRTYGVVLIKRGADRETVADWMGLSNTPDNLDPMYEAAGESVPLDQPHEADEESLLDDLRRMVDELGHAPSMRELDELGEVSYQTYLTHFGSLDEALEAAEVESVRGSKGQIKKEALLEELRRLADELGHAPSTREIDESGEFSYETYRRHFDGLDEALEAAGVESVREPDGRIKREVLLEELRRLADELGHPPLSSEIKELGEFSYDTYARRFGGIEAAREAAGLGDE